MDRKPPQWLPTFLPEKRNRYYYNETDSKSQTIIQRATMIYLYILKLGQDKYYVGTTANIIERLTRHMMGEGARWTKKHPPVELIFLTPYEIRTAAIRAEDEATMILTQHRRDVRGGRWTDPSATSRVRILAELHRIQQTPSCETDMTSLR